MTSQELKNDKQTFITNIDKFIEDYNDALAKVKAINNTLSGCEDTVLKNEMLINNEAITTNISNLITKVSNEKAAIVSRVDQEIRRLEQEERELLLKKQESGE